MNLTKFLLTTLVIVFTVSISFSQQDTVSFNLDSLHISQLDSYKERLAHLERQRIINSVKKSELESQISKLKPTDTVNKKKLQALIDRIDEEETERIAFKKAGIDFLKKTTTGYPVIGFFKDTLFNVYAKMGSFSPEDRAKTITERVKELGDSFTFEENPLSIKVSETTFDIASNNTIVMSVTENDAIWNNTTKKELAEAYRTIIHDEVARYKHETSFKTLAREVGLAFLVLLLIGVLIFLISRLFRWIARKIEAQEEKRIKGIKLKEYTLFDAKKQIGVLLLANKILKWLFISLALYIALPLLFAIFPWTQHFTDELFGFVLNPIKNILSAFWDFVPNLITIIIIVIVFRYILKGVNFFKEEIAKGNLEITGFYPDWAAPTYSIIRILINAFMFVVIFPYLPGSDSPIFKGVSVFLGFLFTFGSAGSLSNIIAGLVLTYMRLFTIGDRVKIGDVTGDVIEKSPLVTRVRTIKNEIISIPNSSVMNSHTINYSSDAPANGLIIHTTVTIGYDVPWKDMYAALIDAALRTELILKEPQPFVLQTSLEDFYVAYQINAYVREANKQAVIYSNLHQNIQDVCNERGIEILSPHYRAARDGNNTTIPSDYLPEDYEAPSFNIKTQSKK